MTQTKRRFLITPLKTSVRRLLEADVQPNFVAQLSGHKNLKSFDSYHSASLKRQREMSAILNREPGTSAQSEENQVSTSTTTQQNVFTVQQIQPQAIFSGGQIDKFEGCTFNINVFCGDRSKIARLNDNWSLHFWSLFINNSFNHKLFHWACMKNFVFIHWRSLYKAGLWRVIFVPFWLETSDRRKPVKCLSPRREANKIIYVFVPLLSCLAI